ncbi:MAG: hypothetical protein ACSLFB_13720 [Acidimicrobiales bacterium]
MPSQQRFEGDSLEELFEKAQLELDNDAVIIAANRLRSGGIGGFFSKERYEIIVEGSPAPKTSMPQEAPRSLLDLADQISDDEANGKVPSISTEQSPFAAVLNRIADDIGLDINQPDLDLTTQATPQRPAPERPPTHIYQLNQIQTPETNPAMETLTSLGLPEALAATSCRGSLQTSDPDLTSSIFTAMQRLPRPPALPSFAGAIVAAVGDRNDALELGRVMAIDLGLDPEQVLLASHLYKGRHIPASRRIAETGVARELGNRWRHQGQTQVIAVESSMSPSEALWAYHMLGALQPAAIWAVVNANHKNEDIVAWTDRLGGVDALALTHLEDTVSPATLLQTGIPIARLNSRPATPALWAALLSERLVA